MEPTQATMIALSLILTFCLDKQEVRKDNTCEDGMPPRIETLNLLTKQGNEINLVEVYKNNRLAFVLHRDGSVTREESFDVDTLAINFWKSFTDAKNMACHILEDTEWNPLKPR